MTTRRASERPAGIGQLDLGIVVAAGTRRANRLHFAINATVILLALLALASRRLPDMGRALYAHLHGFPTGIRGSNQIVENPVFAAGKPY